MKPNKSWSLVAGTHLREINRYFFSDVYFHVPKAFLGLFLDEGKKVVYDKIIILIDNYYKSPITNSTGPHHLLIEIVDEIEATKRFGTVPSLPIIDEIINYLRIKLLSNDTSTVTRTLILLDVLVKNCQFRIHYAIGRKRFMKTLSKVCRYHLKKSSIRDQQVGVIACDIIQHWAQCFYPRRNLYPYICDTYIKLKYKYNIHFPKPDFDATRVPIFLGNLSYSEKGMLESRADSKRKNPLYKITNQSKDSSYSLPSIHEDENVDDEDDDDEYNHDDEGKKSFDEIEDMIKFDHIQLNVPSSTNNQVQNYGQLVPSPMIQDNFNQEEKSQKIISNDQNKLALLSQQTFERKNSVFDQDFDSLLDSLRDARKPPPKPFKNVNSLKQNLTMLESTTELTNIKLAPTFEKNEESSSTIDTSTSLSRSLSKYNQRRQQKKERQNVVAADHDVDIQFFGTQRIVARRPEGP